MKHWILLLGLCIPAWAHGGNVYVVLSSDTSIWQTVGGLNYTPVYRFDVFSDPNAVLGHVFDEDFRRAHTDSAGKPVCVSWFMLGGAYFHTGINSNAITTTHLMRRFWEPGIQRWGDEVAYHFHHYAWTGTEWVMADTFAERAWDFEWTFSQMLAEEGIYPVSFRSGWNYMDTPYQNALEPWIPFRYEGAAGMTDCTPYHPSFEDYRLPGAMKGWEARHFYTKSFRLAVAEPIFAKAAQGQDQVVCIWSHQNESDFAEQIAAVDQVLHFAWTNYPDAPFFYLTGREAMARYQLGADGGTRAAARVEASLAKSPAASAPAPAQAASSAQPSTETLLIADNDAGAPTYTETGTWSQSATPGFNGGIYRYSNAGNATQATWNVVIPRAGYYDISTAFLASTNRADRVRFVIHTPDAEYETFVNQNTPTITLTEAWLRRLLLQPGPVSVTLDSAGSSGSAGQIVISDAVLFRWAARQVPIEEDFVVVDNDDGPPAYTETGTWTLSSATGYAGGTYRYSNAESAAAAVWNALIPRAGFYDFSIAFVRSSNRADMARFVVSAPGGEYVYYVNQMGSGLVEHPTGRCLLPAGTTRVTLDAQGSRGTTGQIVIADAVIFRWASEQVALPSPTPTPSPPPSPTPPPFVTPLPALHLPPPPLRLRATNGENLTTVTISTPLDMYPVQPWLAARQNNGTYIRLDAQAAGAGRWLVSYDRRVTDLLVAGICDIYGSTAIAEVRDGSRRITNQSEFYRCDTWNLDTLTRADRVTLAQIAGGSAYETSGALRYTFDAQSPVRWLRTQLTGETPPGTSLRLRRRVAESASALAGAAWSEYSPLADWEFTDPPAARFIECEALLETDVPSATPILLSLEVFYDPPSQPPLDNLLVY